MDTKKKIFSPAMPMPVPFDIQKRIQTLRTYLDSNHPDYQPEQQHINIKAIIKLYEDGKIDGIQQVHIKDGKIVTEEETLTGGWSTTEGMCYQLVQKQAYGHGSYGPNFHEIRMSLRLTPALGGDRTVYDITALNDTGSDMLTLFDTDLPHLGNIQGYAGWVLPTAVNDASGVVTLFPTLRVQVQLVGDGDLPWTDWIPERAVIKALGPNMLRLSGLGIRKVLYIGTAPGNHLLAVSTSKGGIVSLL